MKMIIAIVNNDDTADVCSALTEENIMFTKVSSTGGFLKTGNTTLLIGIDDAYLQRALSTIEQHCATRSVSIPASTLVEQNPYDAYTSRDITVGGATVFVLDAEQFIKC